MSNTPLICGGWNQDASQASDECHIIDGRKLTLKTKMILKRYKAASIVLNENTLWITGGKVDLGVRTLNVDGEQEFQNYYMYILFDLVQSINLMAMNLKASYDFNYCKFACFTLEAHDCFLILLLKVTFR